MRSQALHLAVTFGDAEPSPPCGQSLPIRDSRRRARKLPWPLCWSPPSDTELPPTCCSSLSPTQRCAGRALRGLAAYDDPKTPAVILAALSVA